MASSPRSFHTTMGGPAAVESDHPDTTTPYWLGGYDSLLFYNGSSQTAICRTDRSRIDKAGVLGYRGTMYTRKRPLHQLISLVLIALISALSVAEIGRASCRERVGVSVGGG